MAYFVEWLRLLNIHFCLTEYLMSGIKLQPTIKTSSYYIHVRTNCERK